MDTLSVLWSWVIENFFYLAVAATAVAKVVKLVITRFLKNYPTAANALWFVVDVFDLIARSKMPQKPLKNNSFLALVVLLGVSGCASTSSTDVLKYVQTSADTVTKLGAAHYQVKCLAVAKQCEYNPCTEAAKCMESREKFHKYAVEAKKLIVELYMQYITKGAYEGKILGTVREVIDSMMKILSIEGVIP